MAMLIKQSPAHPAGLQQSYASGRHHDPAEPPLPSRDTMLETKGARLPRNKRRDLCGQKCTPCLMRNGAKVAVRPPTRGRGPLALGEQGEWHRNFSWGRKERIGGVFEDPELPASWRICGACPPRPLDGLLPAVSIARFRSSRPRSWKFALPSCLYRRDLTRRTGGVVKVSKSGSKQANSLVP